MRTLGPLMKIFFCNEYESGKLTGCKIANMGNIMKKISFLILLSLCIATKTESVHQPNIVLFLADDLGIGDVGCFGNKTLQTPNIDRIAREGARLTHHLTSSSVCTPSRTSLLTGRYPIRAGLATSNIMPVIPFVASAAGLPNNETTFAKLAKSQGYATALIGKWHLGMSCAEYSDFCHHPLRHGFDHFYGLLLTNMKDFGHSDESVVTSEMPNTNMILIVSFLLGILSTIFCYRLGYIGKGIAHFLVLLSTFVPLLLFVVYKNITLLNSIVMRDFDVVEQPIQLDSLTQRFAREGSDFLEDRKLDQRPFLLFMSWTHVHTYLATDRQFVGRSCHGGYGDAVEELDWGVGQILDALDRHDFTNNTLVYFTSDNGGHLEERENDGSVGGGYNGIYKGGKTHGAVDGGIRVPTVIRYPGRILPGINVEEPTSQMDFFPTITNLIGALPPTDRLIDGRDLMPLLGGKENRTRHEFLFHYCGRTIHAVRYMPRIGSDVFKLVYYTPHYLPGQERCHFVCHCQDSILLDTPTLYDMVSDPGEVTPLVVSENPEYQTVVQVMDTAMKEHQQSIVPVPDQYSLSQLMWYPWLQPCCNFPYCSCTDPKYPSSNNQD